VNCCGQTDHEAWSDRAAQSDIAWYKGWQFGHEFASNCCEVIDPEFGWQDNAVARA